MSHLRCPSITANRPAPLYAAIRFPTLYSIRTVTVSRNQFHNSEDERRFPMFARILEFVPLMEKKDEFIRVVKKDVLPLLQQQEGFLEILPLVPENKTEKVLAVTL